jgi:putative nucleotidyltransferase with HDIG domain
MMRLSLRPIVAAANLPEISLAPGESRTIGRAVSADIVIEEPSLSRLHARVSMDDDGGVSIDDLGSTNGVFVDGVQRRSAVVPIGSSVRLGAIDYRLVESSAPSVDPALTILRLAVGETKAPVDRVAVEALLATSRELMACGDLPALLERVLDRLQTILKPDRSAILLVDPVTGDIRPRAVRPKVAHTSISDFASSTVVRDALAAREAVVVFDTRLDSHLQAAVSVARAGVRSVICVPLLGRTGPIGALYADQLGFAAGFTPELVQYASAFAAHAAAALETARLYEDREQHFRATLEAFARAIDARDHYTAGHSERVAAYTLVLARVANLPDEERETIRRSCMLHDIGKVGVPDAVLLKAGPLDAVERAVMETHVTIGYDMLRGLPFVEDALTGVRSHHERWDGRGYPDRIAGDRIHSHARLISVADSYDAMTSARPYRDALPTGEAARRLRKGRDDQFDPDAIDMFDAVEAEFLAICESSRGTQITADAHGTGR